MPRLKKTNATASSEPSPAPKDSLRSPLNSEFVNNPSSPHNLWLDLNLASTGSKSLDKPRILELLNFLSKLQAKSDNYIIQRAETVLESGDAQAASNYFVTESRKILERALSSAQEMLNYLQDDTEDPALAQLSSIRKDAVQYFLASDIDPDMLDALVGLSAEDIRAARFSN